MYKFPDLKILDIDLSSQSCTVRTIEGEIARKYPGGSALGMYLLLHEMAPETEALSKESVLVFAVSPLTGIPISGQSRMVVTGKSPLTGTAGDSQCGGFFPASMAANGWTAFLLRGQAEYPVYIYIDGDNVVFESAKEVWGKTTAEVEDILRTKRPEERMDILQIGLAGENLVRYACIINDCSRANGRLGFGAVMGYKRLRAIAIKRKPSRKPVDPEGLKALTRDVKTRIENNGAIAGLQLNGTSGQLESNNAIGFLPARNWQRSYSDMDDANKLTGETLTNTILIKRDTCFGCAIQCKRVVEVPDKISPRYGGPEYESISTLGAYCDIWNMEEVAYANQLCNMYGLDTISCGATIAFAMECFEKGLLTLEDTDGINLSFGNVSAPGILIPMVARRQGKIGDLLAEGSCIAAKKLGKGTEKYVMGSKGNEFPAHMPQLKKGLAVIYAVNPYGADHQSSEHDTALLGEENWEGRVRAAMIGNYSYEKSIDELSDNKVKYSFDTQKFFSMLESLALCEFAWGPAWQLYGPNDLLYFCKCAIGWETTIDELQEIGERRLNMLRWFAGQVGLSKKDDVLPERVFVGLPSGPAKGMRIDKEQFEHALSYYYRLAGWDCETGLPTEAKLQELCLEWLLEIEKSGGKNNDTEN